MYKEDTIAAIATPLGEGGVAIVRMSGLNAERIAGEIFHSSGPRNGKLKSHILHHGTIHDPRCGAVLDEVLLTIMRKPRSYTGEDVVEVHCHGSHVLVQEILELVLAHGARQADRGEFTKRAFLNGRLDLTQAEAVLDVVRSRTSKSAKLAIGQVRGELSRWVDDLRERLLDILVHVEAAIDFPEEELDLLDRSQLSAQIRALHDRIGALIDTYEWGRLYRDGARVCIAGRPNVGKSSLLNTLVGEERVIVTPEAGTTRDVIEESINLDGLPVVLWDTAGIRETNNQVEKIGVDFSLRRLEEADSVLVVLDGSVPLAPEDKAVIAAVGSKKALFVVNKADLPASLTGEELRSFTNDAVFVSATEGRGVDNLKRTLRRLLMSCSHEPEIVVTNARHKAALQRAQESLKRSLQACAADLPSEILAVDLQETKEALEEIVGVVTNDEILERIFSEFCIGK
ncbi:MAG: tRNA uridine-5-carboxymethylaminomethyl(34) synthesis GTPase MnmE [Candidatus Binatia bacterium]